MAKINEYINKYTREDIIELSKLLGFENKAADIPRVTRRLLSYVGIYKLMRTLCPDELTVFNIVLNSEKGVTLGDIGKNSGLPDKQVDAATKQLAGKLLVYRLKNRMRLHNRLDKIYIMPEVNDFICGEFNNNAYEDIKALYSYFLKERTSPPDDPGKGSSGAIIKFIYGRGGVTTLETVLEEITEKVITKELPSLYKRKQVQIYFDRDHPFTVFLLLKSELYCSLLLSDEAGLSGTGIRVRNSYMLLINLFVIYDTVSTFGLFKTKQGAFRKVDWMRLKKVMLPLYKIDGTMADPEDELQLSLFLLFSLGCAKMRGDSVIVNLKSIKEYFLEPGALLHKLLRTVDGKKAPGGLFHLPFPVPSYNCLKDIVDIVSRVSGKTSNYLGALYTLSQLVTAEKEDLKNVAELRERHIKDFVNGFRFLCLAGIMEIENGLPGLSDAGIELADRFSRKSHSQGDVAPSIYINPDLNIIIPKYELSSKAQYHLLTHTDIISEDMVINARVCRESIVRAYKRGMISDRFLETLEMYSKNEVPQNLRFLVDEWSSGIVEIEISQQIVLHVNNSELLDELFYDTAQSAGIERISKNYALIDRAHLDMLLKYFEKKDAVIRLFENDNFA